MIRPCGDWRVLLSMLLTIAAFLRPILMNGQSFHEPAHTLALMVVVVFLFFFVILWLAEKGLRLASVDGRTHQCCWPPTARFACSSDTRVCVMATGITVTTFVRLPRTMVHGSVRFLITLFLDWRWWLSMLITAHAHPEGPFHPERFTLRWRREGLSATIQGWLTWAFLGYTFGLFAVRIYRGLRAGAEAVRELRSRRPRAESAEAQAKPARRARVKEDPARFAELTAFLMRHQLMDHRKALQKAGLTLEKLAACKEKEIRRHGIPRDAAAKVRVPLLPSDTKPVKPRCSRLLLLRWSARCDRSEVKARSSRRRRRSRSRSRPRRRPHRRRASAARSRRS